MILWVIIYQFIILLIFYQWRMGCAKSQNESHELGRLNTVNGVLNVTILNAKI